MYKFGRQSRDNLNTCERRLRQAAKAAIKIFDFGVISGHRTLEEQAELFRLGKTQLKAGSKHNYSPSQAFDFAPYDPDLGGYLFGGKEQLEHIAKYYNISTHEAEQFVIQRYARIAGALQGALSALGVRSRWGGDWDGDGKLGDNNFDDLGHIEVIFDD